eukprot:TRINITY_DN9052_c0_g1_i2.p1 TRINITY_DN9052_c0_g1~~TRINITY_DN9052_c0_g1_i2.p1  ORF type:complete len:325 (+),score=-28.56 TRINITY_DN9052_c0_g1_i2:174-1148(+)
MCIRDRPIPSPRAATSAVFSGHFTGGPPWVRESAASGIMAVFFRSSLHQLFVRKGRRKLLTCPGPAVDRYGGSLSVVLHRELAGTNLPALLHYEDRNAMAFSIESRVPYLDVRFVEFVASLPLNQKIRGGITKIALRNAIRGIVPEAIRCRMDKMGFVTPEEVWMKEDLRPFVLELLSSGEFAGRTLWNADEVIQNYLAFLEGKAAYSPEIWRIVCTELWLRKFFDHRDLAAVSTGAASPMVTQSSLYRQCSGKAGIQVSLRGIMQVSYEIDHSCRRRGDQALAALPGILSQAVHPVPRKFPFPEYLRAGSPSLGSRRNLRGNQ